MEGVSKMTTPQDFDVEEINASSRIAKVKIDELQVDRTYQRDPSQSLVDKIAAEFDVIASELLLVSDRGERGKDENGRKLGGLWLVNGQHRSLAGRKLGKGTMDARIIDLSDPTKYADPGQIESTFRLKTNVRLGDRPLERFKAQVRSGDEQSLAIVELLARFDTQINLSPDASFGINSVSGIERLFALDNGLLLNETLEIIRDAYGGVGGKNAQVAMLNSIAWFTLKHSAEADRGRLIEKLRALGPAAIDQRSRIIGSSMGGTNWMNYYRAIVEFYNERLTQGSRLDWQLRGAANWRAPNALWGKGPKANE